MARDEFWLLSNDTTLLVWPKNSRWKMFTDVQFEGYKIPW